MIKMMKYFNFDRHDLMSETMLDAILKHVGYLDGNAENMTFGLFDGYYYYDLESELDEVINRAVKENVDEKLMWSISKAVVEIKKVCLTIKKWENKLVTGN